MAANRTELSPAQDRSSHQRRKIALFASALLGVAWLPALTYEAAALNTFYDNRQDLALLATPASADEKLLSRTLLDPIAQHKTRLNCTDNLPKQMISDTQEKWWMIGDVNLQLEHYAPGLPTVVNMSSKACNKALKYVNEVAAGENARPTREIYDFTHEAAHIRLDVDGSEEARVTCAALQYMPEVSQNLGLDEDAQQNLQAVTLKTFFSTWNGLPKQYKSDECSQGGAYDLGIKDVTIAFPYGR